MRRMESDAKNYDVSSKDQDRLDDKNSSCSTSLTGPRWEPPCALHQWKSFLQKIISFDLHIIISIPLFILILAFIIVEGLLYFLVRLSGRLAEKWSNPPAVSRLIRKLRSTESFATYRRCAERLDELTERNCWKYSDEINVNAPGFDVNLVRRKTAELQGFRKDKDIPLLVQCVRTCLDSQLVGTLNPALYSMTFSSTKLISEQLQDEVICAIEHLIAYISDNPGLAITHPELFNQIKRLPKHFGTTALFLSGGAMLGLHHFGLLEALVQNKLLPKVICGTSAGSAAAAFVCTRPDDEILRYLRDPKAMEVYQAPFEPNNWVQRALHYWRHGHTVDLEAWLKRSETAYGRLTFLEAYQITGRVLNISVTRAGAVGESIVLNYLNAPNVLIFSAVLASSAFPWFVHPLHLMEKDPQTGQIVPSIEHSDRYFQDGSLRGDVPVAMLRNRWGANFIVVSQVNFFAFPFLGLRSHGTPGAPVRGWGSASIWRGGFPLAVFEVALKEHLRFLLRVLALLEIVPRFHGTDMTHLALQDYGGDLNIYPHRLYWQHLLLVNNVPKCLVHWFLHIGRQMAFPKMWILHGRLGTEQALRRLSNEIFNITNSMTPRHHQPGDPGKYTIKSGVSTVDSESCAESRLSLEQSPPYGQTPELEP